MIAVVTLPQHLDPFVLNNLKFQPFFIKYYILFAAGLKYMISKVRVPG